jgi:LysR family transcriptional regulator for metE and metH
MYLEFRHLRSVKAIHDCGGLSRAADVLNVTQSALSHQIKALEDQLGVSLFMRKTKPMRLSAAGQRLLLLAEKIMPDVAALEEDLLSLKSGRSGRLHIAIECHACFEWLFPVLEEFRQKWPDIDVDIKPGLSFDALPALAREEVDLVVSSDPEDLTGITFNPLFDYNPIFVAAATHPLAARDFINAEDFRNQTLITYPVERTRLDVFSQLLIPAKVEPHAVRQIELTAIILLLVASNRGVSVLPDWVVRDVKFKSDYITRPLTENGITRSLYAAIRDGDGQRAFMREFVALTQKITGAMQV